MYDKSFYMCDQFNVHLKAENMYQWMTLSLNIFYIVKKLKKISLKEKTLNKLN